VEACGATWCSWKQGKMKHEEIRKLIDGQIVIITYLELRWRNVEIDSKFDE
jgi:hypothetical protein